MGLRRGGGVWNRKGDSALKWGGGCCPVGRWSHGHPHVLSIALPFLLFLDSPYPLPTTPPLSVFFTRAPPLGSVFHAPHLWPSILTPLLQPRPVQKLAATFSHASFWILISTNLLLSNHLKPQFILQTRSIPAVRCIIPDFTHMILVPTVYAPRWFGSLSITTLVP